MELHVEERDGRWYVVDENGGVQGDADGYESRADAMAAMAELAEAGEAESLSDANGTPFHVLIVVEGMETSDGRMFELDGLTPRTPPLPLMWQNRSEHGGFGSDTAALFIGSITEVRRDPEEPTRWVGSGNLADTETARDAEAEIRGGLRGVSVDAAGRDVVYDVRQVDEGGFPIDVLVRYNNAEIMGATVTPFPALASCMVWFADEEVPARVLEAQGEDIPLTDEPEVVDDGMPLLLAGGGPVSPPASWFENPHLDGPTPLTVTDDGRVFGHVADWRTCHVGHGPACVTAPISPTNYAYFHTGEIVCAGGERISVGQLTMATGHAEGHETATQTLAHYDNTGTAVADIRVGEDVHGIWCAGAVRHGLTDGQCRTIMAAAPSGDWRRIGGALELVAVLQVNVPGFPIPRPQAVLTAAGGPKLVQQSLVAAPAPRRGRFGMTDPLVLRRIEMLEAGFSALSGLAMEQVRARVRR